jgi:hypothetical protein
MAQFENNGIQKKLNEIERKVKYYKKHSNNIGHYPPQPPDLDDKKYEKLKEWARTRYIRGTNYNNIIHIRNNGNSNAETVLMGTTGYPTNDEFNRWSTGGRRTRRIRKTRKYRKTKSNRQTNKR